MNCCQIKNQIMKHFDGELNDIETAQLKQHFKSCAECGNEYEELSKIFKIIETNNGMEPPADFEMQVMKKVNALEKSKRKRYDTFLISLYSVTAVSLIILSVMFMAGLRQLNVFEFMEYVGSSLISSGAMIAIHNIIGVFYDFMSILLIEVLQLCSLIFKTYYYVFIALLCMLILIQRMFVKNFNH